MSKKANFLKDCIVTIAADDYENFELIFRQTKHLTSARDVDVTTEEVAEALRTAIGEGLVDAFVLSPTSPHSTKVEFDPDRLHELWYYATSVGKQSAKGMDSLLEQHFLQLRVTYEDLPDLIELSVRVVYGEWSAVTSAYTSPSILIENGEKLLSWVRAPKEPLRIEAGEDTGIGWMALQFYTIDRAGHARCAITLSTKTRSNDPRPAERSRFAIEFPTELGLIEHFARECIVLGSDFKREARLPGLPT